MKKRISFLLALALLLACTAMLAVGAETETATLTAPTLNSYQLTTPDTETKTQSIRFVSTVSSLQGDLLGYEIKADYLNKGKTETKVVSYEKTTDTVYGSLLADNGMETVTAENLGGEAIFAVAMTGVPTDLGEITFTVTPYVTSGETTIRGTTSSFIVENGAKSSKTVLYREDLNGSYTFVGWNTNNAPSLLLANGEGYIASTGTGHWCGIELVSESLLNGVEKYTVELDFTLGETTIGATSWAGFYFNHPDSLTTQITNKTFVTSTGVFPSVILREKIENDNYASDKTTMALHVMQYNRQAGGPSVAAAVTNGSANIDSSLSTPLKRGEVHHYRFDIDNSGATGKITVWVDGVSLGTFDLCNNIKTSGFYYRPGSGGQKLDNIKCTVG